ncbi:hypothetical protein FRC03_009153 [Tulasnella sp. 419]|nr:hypothetical protein FRC03_009153 [Tulasnella sp. 419]
MALITISGYPSSGKSRRAAQIQEYLVERLGSPDYPGPAIKVSVLSDDTLNLKRSAYDDSRSEKPARAAIFTALTRHIGKDTILIIDSMNYIKGFRYQMYCAAKEAEVRTCTVRVTANDSISRWLIDFPQVYVVAPPDECKKWNTEKDPNFAYSSTTLDNLLQRFEEPNSMARWDSPLFTIPWTDESIPGSAIWDTIMSGNTAQPNAAVIQTVKPPTDALQTLENVSASIVNTISSSGVVGGTIPVPVSPQVKLSIVLPPRSISLAELQRHKRQFIAVHKKTLSQGNKGGFDWSESVVAEKFVNYLEEQLAR